MEVTCTTARGRAPAHDGAESPVAVSNSSIGRCHNKLPTCTIFLFCGCVCTYNHYLQHARSSSFVFECPDHVRLCDTLKRIREEIITRLLQLRFKANSGKNHSLFQVAIILIIDVHRRVKNYYAPPAKRPLCTQPPGLCLLASDTNKSFT